MKKVYMLTTETNGDRFESCISFDLNETRRMAEMEVAHLTNAEKANRSICTEGYQIKDGEGTASDQWREFVLSSFETGDPIYVEEI